MSFKKAVLLSVARCDGIIQRHKNSCAGLYYIYKKIVLTSDVGELRDYMISK